MQHQAATNCGRTRKIRTDKNKGPEMSTDAQHALQRKELGQSMETAVPRVQENRYGSWVKIPV